MYVRDNRKDRPHLTIGSINITDKLNSWTIDTNNFSYSDHRYICYDLNYTPVERTLLRYKTKNNSFFKLYNHLKTREGQFLCPLLTVSNPSQLEHWFWHKKNFN